MTSNTTNKPLLSIIIPARNEAGNLEQLIHDVTNLADIPKEIIFVEGNSSDNTWPEIQKYASANSPTLPISAYQQTGKGKANAVRLGFQKATGDLIAIFDADNTVPAEHLREFYAAHLAGQGQLIIGNRFAYPMPPEAMRPLNKLGNKLFSVILSWVLGTPMPDTLCGLKLCSKEDYHLWHNWVQQELGAFDPFGDFELLFPAAALGAKIHAMPVHYRARRYGTTSIRRFRDGWQLLKLSYLGFKIIKKPANRNPR